MPDTKHYSVQIKRGTKAQLDAVPPLLDGELAWITDEGEMYIGTKEGVNKRVTHGLELGDYSADNSDLSISDQLSNWTVDLQEFKDIIKHHVLVNYDAVPEYLSDAEKSDVLRGGVIYADDNTVNLPNSFVPASLTKDNTN